MARGGTRRRPRPGGPRRPPAHPARRPAPHPGPRPGPRPAADLVHGPPQRLRRRTVAVLDGARYLTLLHTLDALLADPPLLPASAAPPGKALARAAHKDHKRLATRLAHALEHPPGPDRDAALHDARKAAKRARYAAEAARPALGRPARRAVKRLKAVQGVLGDHQDSVVAREALRALAVQAHAAGESSFTWGLLYGQEEATAAARERELPGVWARASRAEIRAASEG